MATILDQPKITYPAHNATHIRPSFTLRGKAVPGSRVKIFETGHSERSIGTDGFANYLGEFEIAFTALRGNPGERNAIAVRAYLDGNDSPFSDNVEWTTG